jgi:selenocysteine lyase/cysteine desulfurase
MLTPLASAPPAGCIAALRATEFARLDATGSAYLDYTGSALYPASLVRRDAERLAWGVFGNPHSESAPSLASTVAMEDARRLTLRFLDADPADYDVVFTANASGAIRILAEAFPFRSGSRLVLTADNHNSVNGLRVPARRRRATVSYVPLDSAMRVQDPRPWLTPAHAPSLFAFPPQSNFSGVRHPLDWIHEARRRGYQVLLDAAAYAPSSPVSLTQWPADFVAISFYKLFGYPTGIGALVARRDSLAQLRRAYFGGGTVQFVSVQNQIARGKTSGERFEDGTPNFLAMPAVCDGLEWLNQLGMVTVARHERAMTSLLLARLCDLGDLVTIYGPRDSADRGGTVAFNVHRRGQLVPYEAVEAAARNHAIAIRGGCFCNPGAAEHAFSTPAARARACLLQEFSVPRLRECLGGAPVGALRASVGIPTNAADIDRLIDCVTELAEPRT